MGYLRNHLATVVCGTFAVVLSGTWFLVTEQQPVVNFIFLMAVPIMWFITFACWIAQKSNDYMKKFRGHHHDMPHDEKKS